uniref:Putative LAGLIDADG homing endonuclease n=1 Tax=Xylochloris irregularis TaxID=480381 RepID=A0A097KMF4_9CHLO|nr:putative LAGLIDADG homing endonuclease [Xylochloris irregularis]YP_009105670.1 putative LAGLIDADG homing endonuclease [Xylochloris irregularis]AIT94369.1 putative LAGLIDADG homing endonuclease [Xylochloris irregularis]AIT94371.1 putative LAGLIDADG homing endonuclease [Xylochloris irregularis]
MLNLTPRQNAVLVGGLLGDLHIQKTPATTGKCRLRVCQNVNQKEFVDWKYAVFKNFCDGTKPPFIEKRKNRDDLRSDYLFYTSYRDEFIEPRSVWYPVVENPDPTIGQECLKRIPLNIAEILTEPLALAVWYLDDGTKRSDTDSCRIATQSFSKEEHEFLQDCLKKNFDISVKIEDWGRTKSNKVLYSLAVLSRGGNYKKFRDDIVRAEVPSMLYKL